MKREETHLCPKCGYEYEPWVTVCPDCKSPLTDDLPAPPPEQNRLDPGADPKWTVVTNVPNVIMGTFIKNQLEDAGIPVIIMRSRSADIGEFSHYDYVPHDLRVPLDRLEEARSLVYARPEPFPTRPGDVTSPGYPAPLPQGWRIITDEATASQAGHDAGTPNGWHVYRVDARDVAQGDEAGNEDESEFADDGWSRPQNWVKIFYGILILAISLPFILQLMAQMARIFGP